MPSRLMLVRVTWVWQSNSPGSRWRPATSTASSPSSPGPTSRMRPSSTSRSASAGGAPVPSKTRPPRSSVLVIGGSLPGPGRSTRRLPVLALAGPLGREQVVGQADHVAPGVGHLDQPAGAQLAGLPEQGHPGRGQGLAGRPGVGDLQPQPRRRPRRPRGHVTGPHDQAGLLVAEPEPDHPGVGEVELHPEPEPAGVEPLGDLQVAHVHQHVVQAEHGDLAHGEHESGGRGARQGGPGLTIPTGSRHQGPEQAASPRPPGRSVPVPPDPYERLQAARTAVKALKDERSTLAMRLAELAKGSDEEALVEASMRLDALPTELLRAELKLARADRQAARATLQAAEASLARALANVCDLAPLPDATVKEKLERAAGSGDEDAPEDEQADGDEQAPAETPGLVDAAKQRRGADEQWVRECRLAVERAEQRVRALEARVAEAGRPEPDEPAHRAFAKRTTEARGAIEQARTANGQAELDLIHATELAKVALDGLLAARGGADWRALEHARRARADAAAAVGPAWEALRCAGLRIARADYELDRLVEEWLAGRP